MIISLIVAMDERRGIGKDHKLPWHLPTDLKRFKKLTMGHHLVMGRKTYAAIGRSLPGRVMVVLSHQEDYAPKHGLVAHSLHQALKIAEDAHECECFVIGGGDVFQQVLPLADRIYVTCVHAVVEADTWFPEIDPDLWKIVSCEEVTENEQDEYRTDYKVLVREKSIKEDSISIPKKH